MATLFNMDRSVIRRGWDAGSSPAGHEGAHSSFGYPLRTVEQIGRATNTDASETRVSGAWNESFFGR